MDVEVDLSYGPHGVERFVRRTAKEVVVRPVDASIGIGDDGGLEFNRSGPGRRSRSAAPSAS